MCPEVKMSEVTFLEPLDENGERADDEAVHVEDANEEPRATGAEEPIEDADGDKLQLEAPTDEIDESKAKNQETDQSEPSDPAIAKQQDDENMRCAAEKILKKMG